MTQREGRAEFLMKWFLDVFDNRKASYPSRCFRGIAYHMEEFLSSSPALLRGTGESDDNSLPEHEDHDVEADPELRP
jgi:hypothetical protein